MVLPKNAEATWEPQCRCLWGGEGMWECEYQLRKLLLLKIMKKALVRAVLSNTLPTSPLWLLAICSVAGLIEMC